MPEPVIKVAVSPLDRNDADRLGKALARFRKEDPTLHVMTDPETGETLMAGMGELHLEVYIERIRREYKVRVEVGPPKVSYREAPTRAVRFDHRHRKQTGGAGQYAAHHRPAGTAAGRQHRNVRLRAEGGGGPGPEGVHPVGREGVSRIARQGPGRRFPHSRREGDPGGWLVPRSGQQRHGVSDGGPRLLPPVVPGNQTGVVGADHENGGRVRARNTRAA